MISTMRERTPFPASLLAELPNLQLLLTTGMRNASLDLEAARETDVVVAGTTGRGKLGQAEKGEEERSKGAEAAKKTFQPTAQHTWSLILALTSRVAVDSPALTSQAPAAGNSGRGVEGYGPWQSGFSVSLAGKTLGLVGLGKLGAQVARTGVLGFGMQVIAWGESLTQERADEKAVELGVPVGSFKAAGKEELFRTADVVSVHYVLSERSSGVVGERELGCMKREAFLVNTSRGPLIDKGALYRCLIEGRIKGAGLDVFWREPLEEDSRWRRTLWGREGRSDVILTPHMGYVEKENLKTWYEEQAENVERWLNGVEVLNRMN